MEPTGLATPSPGQTKRGRQRLSVDSRVSRTRRRKVGVRRKRRSRVSGKLMALGLYRGEGGEGNAPEGRKTPGPAAPTGRCSANVAASSPSQSPHHPGPLLPSPSPPTGGRGRTAKSKAA